MEKQLKKIQDVIDEGPYKDDWLTLGEFQVPKWFKEAKFGIFIHWGVYSVPAFGSEWYPRNMYIKGTEEFNHHIKTYGPHKVFGYKDFIPLFKAERFNPKEWAQIIKDSGARYVCPVAEHHDGFQMYKSSISKYNAYEMGPKRDILGELKEACEQEGLTFCASSHRAEHWFFMSHGKMFESDIKEPLKRGDFYWPSVKEPNHQELQSQPYPSQEYLEDWLLRTCEIIDQYEPSMLYFDWWIQHEAFKPYLKQLAAYYYNKGHKWDKEVAISYKHDAFMFGTSIVDVERGKFADVKPYYWQTDTAVAKNSWCYTETLDYKTSHQIITNLIDVVSKNGNMLLNIGPKGDGSIPEGDQKILKEIGDWLKVNGEAIYGTKPWRKASEGPTKEEEGQFSEGNEKGYTYEDFRFTVKGDSLYVAALNYPKEGKIIIQSLKNSKNQNIPEFHGIIKEVCVLGYDEKPLWEKTEEGLKITTSHVSSNLPIIFKVVMA